MIVKHHRRLETAKTHTKLDSEVDKEIKAWTEANMEASEREDSGSKEV